MPKNGYTEVVTHYNIKFSSNVTEKEIRSRIATCKRKRVATSAASDNPKKKLIKLDNSLQKEEGKLPGMFEVARIKEIFYKHLEANEKISMDERPRTKKIPNRKVCFKTIGGLNIVVSNHLKDREDIPFEELSMLIYTTQKSYDEITARKVLKSNWIENNTKKINDTKNDVKELMTHIDAVKNNKKITMSKKVKKILKKSGSKRRNLEDLQKAADMKREYACALEKRLQMHSNRVKYRRENDLFEFNRKLFYRKLNDSTIYECDQNSETMLDFWGKMWESQNKGKKTFDVLETLEDVKVDFDLDAVEEDHGEKIQKMIDNLPNWKTPGIDQVYNFFIKI